MMREIYFALSAVLALACFAAVGAEFWALQESGSPDTEVSTNAVISVGTAQRLRFTVELSATPTNNVEVSVGFDADENGRLSIEESALTVGYDCGRWFVRSAVNDSVAISSTTHAGVVRRSYEIPSSRVDHAWNLVKVTRRGLGVSSENVTVEVRQSGFGVVAR